MDAHDIEQLAVETYEREGLDAFRPTSTIVLARKVLRDDRAVVRAPLTMSGAAKLGWWRGRRRIAVKRGLPRAYALHAIGHELSHHVLELAGYDEPDVEAVCDQLGAALGAPRPAVRRLHGYFGLELGELALHMRATQTSAALRLGEAMGLPIAAIAPHAVRVRGDEWGWPDERTIRSWATGDERPWLLQRLTITDGGRARAALVAKEG